MATSHGSCQPTTQYVKVISIKGPPDGKVVVVCAITGTYRKANIAAGAPGTEDVEVGVVFIGDTAAALRAGARAVAEIRNAAITTYRRGLLAVAIAGRLAGAVDTTDGSDPARSRNASVRTETHGQASALVGGSDGPRTRSTTALPENRTILRRTIH
jgi:hypothetical protein